MKKSKYRVIRVAYRHRIRYRVKRERVSSNKSKLTVLPNHTPNPHAKQALKPYPTSNLATFDRASNPYQQFVDNLSTHLTNLPQEAFVQTAEPLADSWPKEEGESTPATDLHFADTLPKPPISLDNRENLSQHTQKESNTSKAEETKKLNNNRSSVPTQPNLQNLLGIVSCLLASNH